MAAPPLRSDRDSVLRDALEAVRRAERALEAALGERDKSAAAAAPRQLVRAKEAAARFGVTDVTARRWAKAHGRKIGGTWFVDLSQLVHVAPRPDEEWR